MRTTPPDGLGRERQDPHVRANPLPLLVLAALMLAGMLGVFGGMPDPVRRAERNGVALAVQAPQTLRTGMVFETTIRVRPKRPIDDMIVAVSDDLWREMTINTMIPAAQDESHKADFHLFSFGAADAGESFAFKIDGQINPPLLAGRRGVVRVLDGQQPLVEVVLNTEVWP